MNNLAKTVFLLFFCAFFGNSQASPVTLMGSSVSYTFDDALLGLFGAPTLGGDSLFFSPTAFNATSAGVGFATETMNIKVDALNGGTINTINLTQGGDIVKVRDGDVDAFGSLDVKDLGSGSLPVSSEIDFDGLGSSRGLWTGKADVDFSSFAASSINVSLFNLLFAFADNGFASINMRSVLLGVSATPAEVPLPASVWLFGSALLGCFASYKRKSDKSPSFRAL
jgi:hypothetical protein